MTARILATLGLAAAILSPLLQPKRWDSFPISSYPMFARADLGAENELAHIVLVRRDGRTLAASPVLVGTSEPMIAMSIIRSHVSRGAATELCARAARNAHEALPDVVAVEVVTSVFDARYYFSEGPDAHAPLRRTVHARCDVAR